MKRPSDTAFFQAMEWLRSNEGDEGEADNCAAVADWIEHQLESLTIRGLARAAGVPASALRKKLAEQKAVREQTNDH